jgi:undecaprenyl-diphosphatase
VIQGAIATASRAANHSALWLGCAALVAACGGERGRAAALNGLASIALASPVVNLVLKPLGHRRRPDRNALAVPLTRQVTMPRSTSWPSGHAASAFAFATGVGAAWPAVGVPLSVVASLVGYSRVHTGVHYPSDAIAGTVSGVSLAPVAVAGVRRGRRMWAGRRSPR